MGLVLDLHVTRAAIYLFGFESRRRIDDALFPPKRRIRLFRGRVARRRHLRRLDGLSRVAFRRLAALQRVESLGGENGVFPHSFLRLARVSRLNPICSWTDRGRQRRAKAALNERHEIPGGIFLQLCQRDTRRTFLADSSDFRVDLRRLLRRPLFGALRLQQGKDVLGN